MKVDESGHTQFTMYALCACPARHLAAPGRIHVWVLGGGVDCDTQIYSGRTCLVLRAKYLNAQARPEPGDVWGNTHAEYGIRGKT